jgi:hypothetical protein
MKKLLALGVSALTAAAIAFGPTVASAEEPPTIAGVCDAIGGIDLGDLLGEVDTALTDANDAVATAETDADEAMADYIAAAVATLQAVDAGDDNVGELAAEMQERFDALVDAIVGWSEAMVDQYVARQEAFTAGLQNDFLEGLTSGLDCGGDA